MTFGTRVFVVLLLQGVAWGALAEQGGHQALNKKPARLSVNIVKQKDGSVVERLDMSTLPGANREGEIPGSPAEWLARMIDPTRNGLVVKHPQLFAEWLDAVTEPRFMTALATVALDPATFPRTLNRLADPATARNLAEFVDPEVFMRWMAAGMDPNLYQAVFQHMFDPRKYLRWATYSANFQSEAVPAREANRGASGVQNSVGDPVTPSREGWLQLPGREPGFNPWLPAGNHPRY